MTGSGQIQSMQLFAEIDVQDATLNSLSGSLGLLNYWIVILLMMTGFYIVIGQRNLIKSIIGLNIFQTSVFLLYITMGKVRGGTAPIIQSDANHAMADHGAHASGGTHAVGETAAVSISDSVERLNHDHLNLGSGNHGPFDSGHLVDVEILYSNPLPSVLMLTAIVVGIATTALALSLIVRIREEYGTIEEDEILALDFADDANGDSGLPLVTGEVC